MAPGPRSHHASKLSLVPGDSPAKSAVEATTSQIPESDAHARPIRVLLVDDDREAARGIERALGHLGNNVTLVSNGSAALAAIQVGRYDVVLSDIGMPEMDGFELLHAIRRIDAHVPIVLLTGEPTVSTAARALEVGAFRYVTKPVEIRDLAGVVEKAARLHRMAKVKDQAARLLGTESQVGTDRESLNRNFERCLDSLWMAFQPIIDPRAGRIFGFESLMRSREATLPHPGAVLDAAEQLGRLDELGRTIRELTARSIPTASGDPAFFVNLHVRDLLDPTLLEATSPLAPYAHQIVLEVTERASLAEVPDVRQRIAILREMGFRIAVDDLGAGYAGLTSFALLEPEFVKLDMSLIRDVHQSPTKRKVVRSMVNLAQDMGMLVVGEGVECVEESDTLIELGCDFLQGYLFAKPAPPFPEVAF